MIISVLLKIQLFVDDIKNISNQQWILLNDTSSTGKSGSRAVNYKSYIFVIGGNTVVGTVDAIDTTDDAITLLNINMQQHC